MTNEEQLLKWVKGKSVHNDNLGVCCPDFSCCNPKVNTPLEVRELFMEAYLNNDTKQTGRMLGVFLGQAISTISDKKVYIAGLVDLQNEANG